VPLYAGEFEGFFGEQVSLKVKATQLFSGGCEAVLGLRGNRP